MALLFLGKLANAVQRPGRYLQTGRPEKVLAMFVLGVWVTWFVLLGRMALTNYLGQTVVGLLLFYGYGLNLTGRVGMVWTVPLTFLTLAAQWGFSVLWLRHHAQGPVEWLWRRLTYGRPSPRRHAATA